MKNSGRFILIVVVVVALVLIAKSLNNGRYEREDKNINTDTYQAVFLTNGQHYFGHLDISRSGGFTLADVYYVRQQGEAATSGDQQFQLVKFGSEIHGPEDQLFLNKDNVLFWENLRADSKVVNGIAQDKARSAQSATQPPVVTAPTADPLAAPTQ